MGTAVEPGLEVQVSTGLQVATTRPVTNSARLVSHPCPLYSQYSGLLPACFSIPSNQSPRPFQPRERATESDLEVEAPTGLQVAPQLDENKYYIGGGGPDHPLFVPPNQSFRSQAKSPSRIRANWVLSVIIALGLAVAVGVGLGIGLHKSTTSRSPHIWLLASLPFA